METTKSIENEVISKEEYEELSNKLDTLKFKRDAAQNLLTEALKHDTEKSKEIAKNANKEVIRYNEEIKDTEDKMWEYEKEYNRKNAKELEKINKLQADYERLQNEEAAHQYLFKVALNNNDSKQSLSKINKKILEIQNKMEETKDKLYQLRGIKEVSFKNEKADEVLNLTREI
jgi:hypothetical protein